MENALKKIIDRHEIFRTSFEFIDEEPRQIINKNWEFKINVINTEESSGSKGESLKLQTRFNKEQYSKKDMFCKENS
jgi:hypothetical protein